MADDTVIGNDKFGILNNAQLSVLQNTRKRINKKGYKLSNNFDILGTVEK